MPTARLARATAALLTTLLVAGCAAASVSPTMSEAPASLTSSGLPIAETDGGRVTSPRFGWSAILPAGWRFRQATEDWPPHTNPAPGARYTDNIEHASGFPILDVSSQMLPADQSREAFQEGLDRFAASIGCTVDAEEETTVDGEPARLQRQTCAAGTETVWEVVVFDGEWAYAIYWLSRVVDADADEPLFRDTLATFRFPS